MDPMDDELKIAVEVSMYPLCDEYLPAIDDFLAALAGDEAVEVQTNRMSTLLYGDYDGVLNLLRRAMRESHQSHHHAAYVCKLIPGAARRIGDYD